MNRGELLEYLTKSTGRFIVDENNISRNEHLTGVCEAAVPRRFQIKGVLVAFINHVGVEQGLDYALSYKDL